MIHLYGTQAVAFRVLVVDRDPVEREIFARCVRMLGWSADTAEGLHDGAAKFNARPHAVVAVDLRLDKPDCVALLAQLRHDHCDPVVIFVAATDDRARAAMLRIARERGIRVAGVLTRPIDPYRLHALLLSNPVRPRDDGWHTAGEPTARDLEEALAANEIHTEYQPKSDLITGEVVGVEALARWHSGIFGTVPPDQFVPVAEQSGLISRLTFRVLEAALAACRRWRAVRPDCSVAVNMSAFVLTDPAFLPKIDALLEQNNLPAGALTAEITETTLLAHLPAAMEVLTRLSLKGVLVSMGGFGTGCSSVQTLLRMPFTELKIDRSFVGVCRTDPDAWRLVRTTISMARELGMHVVAEGIETEAISDRLRDVGCDMGQGWYFGRPMQEDALLRWLAPVHGRGGLSKAMLMANLLIDASQSARSRTDGLVA